MSWHHELRDVARHADVDLSLRRPWDRKGSVMRALHDEARGGEFGTIDGIRIPRNGGWVLILPDASEASVNVIAESTTDESAESSAAEMAAHITQLVHG